jgi:hypothetical protein
VILAPGAPGGPWVEFRRRVTQRRLPMKKVLLLLIVVALGVIAVRRLSEA